MSDDFRPTSPVVPCQRNAIRRRPAGKGDERHCSEWPPLNSLAQGTGDDTAKVLRQLALV